MDFAVVLTVIGSLSTVIGITLTIISFANNNKEKAIKDVKELDNEHTNQTLIDYRLTKVEEKLDRIIGMFDNFEKEVKDEMKAMIKTAMDNHILMYHSKKKKGDE